MFKKFIYSFPIQLLINNLKRNPALILCWLVLFSIVTGNFGKLMGIPYLFLDPEYLNRTDFLSFFLIGITLGGFTMAYHITCYITDGPRYSFLGGLSRPFTKFCLNNSIIPATFLGLYLHEIILFQIDTEHISYSGLVEKLSGLFTGFFLMLTLLFAYFRFTNKDIVKILANNLDKQMRRVKVTRVNVMQRLKYARNRNVKVDYYLDLSFRLKKVDEPLYSYDKAAILKVFDQNHLNSIIVESFIFVLILILGIFRENPYFQIPAAASFFLFLTIVLMIAGALSFWLRKWSLITLILFFLVLNFMVKNDIITAEYQAYGLDYSKPPVEYTLQAINNEVNPEKVNVDKKATLETLENWRNKFPADQKPKMIFICASGGGQRAALWTVRSLQMADSLTQGNLMKHTMLMTGASGGLVGAAYYRELFLRKQLGENIDLHASQFQDNVSKDVLNPVIFSLLVNDFFIRYQHYEYNGFRYLKDRGYSFEQQLNYNTDKVLDKPLGAYAGVEKNSTIPMMIIAPNVINDGRKLYISPQPVSYMNIDVSPKNGENNQKVKGIDFQSFFEEQGAEDLRFLTALRMSATFPYITPNISLPSTPRMKMMDSGISDNFGVADAVRFLYVFKDWISENTSGVIFVSIRDSQKNIEIEKTVRQSLFEKFFIPIRSLYKNFDNIQDIQNDNQIEFAREWFNGDFKRIDIQYMSKILDKSHKNSDPITEESLLVEKEIERASLSWRLTAREKENIKSNIYLPDNQKSLMELKKLLENDLLLPAELVRRSMND
ncbi:hypothetical protein BH23BAC1_BH23BAC1_28710 [soil metagenome]